MRESSKSVLVPIVQQLSKSASFSLAPRPGFRPLDNIISEIYFRMLANENK